MTQILIAASGMAILGLFWSIIIAFANKLFSVAENPLIQSVVEHLPGVNCGACGFAGCGGLAQAIVEKNEKVELCMICKPKEQETICKILGRAPNSKKIKQISVLHCLGSHEHTQNKAEYFGYETCATAQLAAGGAKTCAYGCLGFGDCVLSCPFQALIMQKNGLPKVLKEKCTACGICVEKCPKKLFKLLPIDQKVMILCSSQDPLEIAKKACKTSCLGCGLCAKFTENEVFQMHDYLAVVDYEKAKIYDQEKIKTAAAKCPNKIIKIN